MTAFIVDGICLLVWPFLGNLWMWGAALLAYGLANGLISPLQKSLLTRNAPTELRGGVISVDRVFHQLGKSLAPAVLGVVLVTNGGPAVFWTLGLLSLMSVLLSTAYLGADRFRRRFRPTMLEPNGSPRRKGRS